MHPVSHRRSISTLWLREPDSILRAKLGLPPKPLDVEEDDEYETWKLDPYNGQPEGLTLVRRMGLLAISQLERRKWVYHPDEDEWIKEPSLELWKKYRGPPGKPAEDDAAIDALPEMRALRAKYERALEEERLTQREREQAGMIPPLGRKCINSYDAENYLKDGVDPFGKVVYYENMKSNWDPLRSPGLFAAAARTDDHKQAFIEKGWLRLRDDEIEKMEERDGVVISELERTRRNSQRAADWAENEYDWEDRKQAEMDAWLALDKERIESSSS